MVGRTGFEPVKAVPSDLQSDPFGHSGISPGCGLREGRSYEDRPHLRMGGERRRARSAARVLGPTHAGAGHTPDRRGDRGRCRPTTLARMPGTGAAAPPPARRAGGGIRSRSIPCIDPVEREHRGPHGPRPPRGAGVRQGGPCERPHPRHGASGGSRTHNLLITNQVLCRLSYAGPSRVGGSPNEPSGSARGGVRVHASGAARRVEGEIVGFASRRSSIGAGNLGLASTPGGHDPEPVPPHPLRRGAPWDTPAAPLRSRGAGRGRSPRRPRAGRGSRRRTSPTRPP